MKICTRTAFVLGVMIAPLPSARAQASDAAEPDVRTVGTATRGVRPDLAAVTLQLLVEGRSAAEAGSRMAARIDTLRRSFIALGISRDSLVSRGSRYWGQSRIDVVPQPPRYVPRIQPAPNEPRNDVYYDTLFRAHDGIDIHLSNIMAVGAVIDAALKQRVTEISPVRFTLTSSHANAVHDSLVAEATVRARREASIIAIASGSQLGTVRSLNTQGDPMRGYLMEASVASLGPERSDVPTSIIEPLIQVSATVYGRWQLITKP
jgi:uncharacterized protein YggE